ncbi:MAG: UDP-N-acetyl-D-galactosamine dehydrogenase [Rhodobacteraceae bacterium]|nr:MAG: UDP-N-acetyl-D-galactosamine dehydrogenase [Paracoccaceae bacterium]
MNVTTPLKLVDALPVIPFRTDETIAVIGLGYVGLPVAVGFARHFADVIGFDINPTRIRELNEGFDNTLEIGRAEIEDSRLVVTQSTDTLSKTSFFIVTVPTPIDKGNRPDLAPLRAACETIAPHLSKDAIVVFESTVYPGVTEDICGPILSEISGLRCGVDFKLGYSPERINPGDTEHRLETIIKVVAAQDAKSLQRMADVYGTLVHAGVHRAPTIRVAEAAKVIENTQRDVNIALMNEIAIICDHLGVPTSDVIEAASTKWNFLPFTPGLVGGHCIGVDPYYLTAKAEEVGYHSEVILSGRRVNDGMGAFIAAKAIKMLAALNVPLSCAKVGVLGLTFKENVPDLRNSKTFDVLDTLAEFGVRPMVHDPMATRAEIPKGAFDWVEASDMSQLDLLILAVPHDEYMTGNMADLVREGGAVIDIRSALNRAYIPEKIRYWSL